MDDEQRERFLLASAVICRTSRSGVSKPAARSLLRKRERGRGKCEQYGRLTPGMGILSATALGLDAGRSRGGLLQIKNLSLKSERVRPRRVATAAPQPSTANKRRQTGTMAKLELLSDLKKRCKALKKALKEAKECGDAKKIKKARSKYKKAKRAREELEGTRRSSLVPTTLARARARNVRIDGCDFEGNTSRRQTTKHDGKQQTNHAQRVERRERKLLRAPRPESDRERDRSL